MELAIRRGVPDGEHLLLTVFPNFDESPALREIFPEDATAINDIVVRLGRSPKYMRVLDDDGSISIGNEYLRTGDVLHIYLDLVHEVTHVKQQRDGLPLYDPRYRYIDRPTEIEAMQITLKESRRCGMTDQEIVEYFEVPWITRDEHEELMKRLGLRI